MLIIVVTSNDILIKSFRKIDLNDIHFIALNTGGYIENQISQYYVKCTQTAQSLSCWIKKKNVLTIKGLWKIAKDTKISILNKLS